MKKKKTIRKLEYIYINQIKQNRYKQKWRWSIFRAGYNKKKCKVKTHSEDIQYCMQTQEENP